MKEEEDINILCSLVQVGVSCSTWGRGTGAFAGGGLALFSLFFHMSFYSPLYSYPCISISFYLWGLGPTEKGQFPVGGGPQLRSGSPAPRDWGAGEDGSSSGRLRGRGFLWASEGSGVTPLHILSLTSPQETSPYAIHHYPPSTPSGVHKVWSPWSSMPGNGVCLSSCAHSFRGGNHCQYATPLHSAGECQVGI